MGFFDRIFERKKPEQKIPEQKTPKFTGTKRGIHVVLEKDPNKPPIVLHRRGKPGYIGVAKKGNK